MIAKHKPVEMSKKQEAIFDVLINFSAYRTSKDQIIDVFNDWIKTVKENVYVESVGDLVLLVMDNQNGEKLKTSFLSLRK